MLKIEKKRIRSLQQFAPLLKGKKVALCVEILGNETKAKKAGFSETLAIGESMLPTVVGPVTHYNVYGKEIVRRDLPKETLYRQAEWTWEQWAGQGQTETRSKIVDIPYQKYPRDHVPAPGLELKLTERMIASPVYSFPEDEEAIVHAANVFLETFGECRLADENLEDFVKDATKNVNWKILPPGKMPWSKLKEHLEPVLTKAKPQVRIVFEDRLQVIEENKPNFRAFGMGGYEGYVVFGFEKKGVYICESIRHGNAIYVFDENWEEFSQKTKAEVIQKGLQKERIVHYGDWKKRIRGLLGEDSRQIYTSAVEKPRSINSSSNTPKQSVVV